MKTPQGKHVSRGDEEKTLSAQGDWRLPPKRMVIAVGPHIVAVLAVLAAFRELYTVGTRYSFEKGVEYWLFLPGDSAPIVVILIAVWLAYRRSNRLRALTFCTGPWRLSLPLLGLGAGFFAWAVYTQALDLEVLALALVVSGLLIAYLGLPGLRALWLPIVVLLFAVPLPAPLLLAVVFKMQIWTADLAGFALYLLGIPHLVSGDQILRVSQAFQVIEGCSGMRSVQILTLLTVLLIDLFQRRGWHAVILVIFAPLLAFGLNGVRVLTLILNPHSEIIAIHNLQGIVILLVGLVIVYCLDAFLERFDWLDAAPPPLLSANRGFAPSQSLAVTVAFAVGFQALNLWLPVWQAPPDERPSLHPLVGDALDNWASEKIAADFSFRGSARFGEVVNRKYHMDGGTVSVFVAESDFDQRGGSPLSPITALPGSGWKVAEESVAQASDDQWVRVRVVEKGKRRLLVHHWVEGSRGLAAETLRAFFALDRSPFRRPDPILVFRLSTPLQDRRSAALEAAGRRLERIERSLSDGLVLARY
jgi:exosortase